MHTALFGVIVIVLFDVIKIEAFLFWPPAGLGSDLSRRICGYGCSEHVAHSSEGVDGGRYWRIAIGGAILWI